MAAPLIPVCFYTSLIEVTFRPEGSTPLICHSVICYQFSKKRQECVLCPLLREWDEELIQRGEELTKCENLTVVP